MTVAKRHKIAFIETNPLNLRGSYTKCNNFEPYGLEVLAALAQKDGLDVGIFQQNEISDEEFIKNLLAYFPDMLAFSCMTFNYDSSLQIAELAKKQNPDVKVIFGGPHISSYPGGLEEPLKRRVIDCGICGEADRSFGQLVSNLDSPNTNLEGLILIENGKLRINSKSDRIKNLDDLPFAFRDPKILARTKVGRVMYPAQSEQVATATISYSRGCPFGCSFCDSKHIWGNNVLWRSAKNVVDEIEELKGKFGTNTVFFSDLTFNSNPEKIRELCDELYKRKTDVSWYVLARVAAPNGRSLLDGGLIRKMYNAGCRKIGYGLESFVPEIQEEFKKTVPYETLNELIDIGHELGILNKGFIILGEPEYESQDTVGKTLEALKGLRLDEIRISFLTPFPGSDLYEKARTTGLLLTEDLSRYTTDEPVLKCKNLSPVELIEARIWLARKYYLSEEYQGLIKEKISKFPHLRKSYEEHHEFLVSKSVISD